ncbi:MAG: Lar family restriction alleviation protein [Alloprevotella sp.]|nr:Lar family restriction alleviation protein [Alloprevotella sp.]MBR1447110.1 Lar family restriction alleviation protein [Alloprevotella sp.]
MTATNLLPCPFCGGEASKRLFYGGRYSVYCDECDARVGGLADTEAEAIAAWNARAERTCKVVASYDTADVDSRGSNAEWYFAFTCGDELYWDEPEPPSYCPSCGAKVVER